MIPYAIMSMKLLMKDGTCSEVRILDLSVDSLTFRLANPPETEMIEEVCIHYYHPIPGLRRTSPVNHTQDSLNRGYEEVILNSLDMEDISNEEGEQASPYYRVYRISSDQENFHRANQRLMEAYMGYIRGKWELDGGELAGELTGYPVEQEEIYPETWEKQRSHWYGDSASLSPCKCSLPIGLILAERNAWGKLLSSVLSEQSIPDLQLSKENISASAHSDASVLQVTYLYLGNAYCHHLLPNLEEWKELVEAAIRIGCQPVILLPPLREAVMEKILEERIRPLVLWWKDNLSGFIDTYGYAGDNSLEIVVNDWGMVEACGRLPDVSITLGNHLNKYRKDVRLPWRHYDEKEYRLLRESAGLPKEYLSWLQKNHRVKGISWEVCGYVPVLTATAVDEEVIALEHTLYLPMMSMNTGGHCTLRAVCETGDRGHQRYAEACPGYCRDHAFLYPDFLGMVGRYHTLWGYDPKILTSDEYLQEWIRQGITRIVWNGV